MLRKFVYVGFHSSQGVGAHAVMGSYYENSEKISHEVTQRDTKKKQKNQCNLCNLWFLLFHRFWVRLAS
jgi:hypothetical protein